MVRQESLHCIKPDTPYTSIVQAEHCCEPAVWRTHQHRNKKTQRGYGPTNTGLQCGFLLSQARLGHDCSVQRSQQKHLSTRDLEKPHWQDSTLHISLWLKFVLVSSLSFPYIYNKSKLSTLNKHKQTHSKYVQISNALTEITTLKTVCSQTTCSFKFACK